MITSDTISVIVDKSTATNIDNYNNVTYIDDKTPDTVTVIENNTYIISEYVQGPAGPPTGYSTDVVNLPFIGSGVGASKTVTGINGNIIYEGMGVGDELFVIWKVPVGIDRSVNGYFTGSFFPLNSEVGTFSSWEIHITAHSLADGTEITDIIYANDLPLSDIAYEHSHGIASIDHTIFLAEELDILHIKLKRVASTKDPIELRIGVSDLAITHGTEGKVGIQGDQGPIGPGGEEELMFAKRVDFIEVEDLLYRGEAVPGTVDADSLWRIRRITIAATDSDVAETWADGNDNFDKVWNNRLTYTYS
jgi:hypothetical protein